MAPPGWIKGMVELFDEGQQAPLCAAKLVARIGDEEDANAALRARWRAAHGSLLSSSRWRVNCSNASAVLSQL